MTSYIKSPYRKKKIKRVQYNACLVITDSFKGTSRERLYQELGLEDEGVGNCVSLTKL